jgi:hypothetical protein
MLKKPGPRKAFGAVLPKSFWVVEVANCEAVKQRVFTSVQERPTPAGSMASASTVPPELAESRPGIWLLVTAKGRPV